MGAQTDGVGWNQLGEESQQPLTSADASEEDDWARIVMETYPPGVQDLIKERLKSEARIARVHKEQLRGQTGQLLQHASQQGSVTTTNLIASGCDSEQTEGHTPEMLELINKESKARNRLHHFKMKRVGVPEKAKQDASFNVTIRRCGDDGGGKRSRSDGRGVGVNSSGTMYWDTLCPISRKEAETTTLLDLCSMVKQERRIWLSAAASEGKEIGLVVLRDGFDKDDRFVVPYHRLGEYTLDGLRRDGLISLRAGSKVCFQVEYLDKPDESEECCSFPLPSPSS